MSPRAKEPKGKGVAVSVSQAVRKARLRARLNQVELAKRIGTSQKGITSLESGRHNTTIGTLERVAKATGSLLDVRLRPKSKAR